MTLAAVATTQVYKRPPFVNAQFPIANGVTIADTDVMIGLATSGYAGPLTLNNGSYPSPCGLLVPNGRYPLPATGDSSGLTYVTVTYEPIEMENCDVTGVTGVTDHEQPVYATDSKTLTLSSSGNANLVGYVKKFRATGKADVHFFSHADLLAPRV